jgi:hypothetical protein
VHVGSGRFSLIPQDPHYCELEITQSGERAHAQTAVMAPNYNCRWEPSRAAPHFFWGEAFARS